jgi:hypothetical protein
MLKLSSIRADLEREKNGDWVDARSWPGVRFFVSALTKPSYQLKRDALVQRLQRKHKGKPVPTEELAPHLGKLYAEEIVHGWDGIDVSYSPEKALELLTDPTYRELVSEIEYCAATLSSVDADFVETEVGKFERLSAPSSKSAVKSETSSAT